MPFKNKNTFITETPAHSTYLAYTHQESKLATIITYFVTTMGSHLTASSVQGFDGVSGIVFPQNS